MSVKESLITGFERLAWEMRSGWITDSELKLRIACDPLWAYSGGSLSIFQWILSIVRYNPWHSPYCGAKLTGFDEAPRRWRRLADGWGSRGSR